MKDERGRTKRSAVAFKRINELTNQSSSGALERVDGGCSGDLGDDRVGSND